MNTICLNLHEPIPFSAFEHPINAAIILSLFCDARDNGERGWWGDALAQQPFDQWGSRLWSREKGKNTQETLHLVEDCANEALKWMIQDKVAHSVMAKATAIKNETLYLSIVIDGKPVYLEVQYAY